jgi:leucyl-tRNA synthetase
MYLMFLGPFQEGGDFRDEGITGIRRFLERVWVLAHEAAAGGSGLGARASGAQRPSPDPEPRAPSPHVERKLHQTIKKVTSDTETLNYNTAISAMMEYVNELRTAQHATLKDSLPVARSAAEPLVIMLAPYAPHLAEELWELLGHATSVFEAPWPTFNERLAQAEQVELVIQVNGKVRGRLTVARGLPEGEVVQLALADQAVKKFVDGRPVKKVIYVQDRLVNLVV